MPERVLWIVWGVACDWLRLRIVRFLRPQLDREYHHWLRTKGGPY